MGGINFTVWLLLPAKTRHRRLCSMQRRRCRANRTPAARRPRHTIALSRGSALRKPKVGQRQALGVPNFSCAARALDVLNGGMTSVSSQASGAQRRLRGACESQTRAAPAYALRISVLASRRKNGTTRRSSLQVLKSAAASQGRLAKSFILGYAQWADRGVLVAVPSESDSAPRVGEKWVRRGR